MNGALEPGRAGSAVLDLGPAQAGRRIGAIRIAHSHDRSAYGAVVLPVAVIEGRPGPTVLLTGGVHGDEFEGPMILHDLVRKFDPSTLTGRLIVLPVANPLAIAAARRLSPADEGNLARCFPGDRQGTVTKRIAAAITDLLLPHADALVDFHSGGGSLDYFPCTLGRLPADQAARAVVLDLMEAFAAPICAIVTAPAATGTLVAQGLERGIPAFATELGGGGGVTAQTLAIGRSGLKRVMAHLNMIGEVPQAQQTGRLVAVGPDHFIRSPGRGAFEPAVGLLDELADGAAVGLLRDLDRLDREPETIRASASGTVICRRVPAHAEAGDVLVHLGADVTRQELMTL